MKFLVNEVKYDEKHTANISDRDKGKTQRDFLELQGEHFDKCYENNINSHPAKQFFKRIFGRQMKCVIYSYRNWIWTFSSLDKEQRIWALVSTRGATWEYDTTSKYKIKIYDLFNEILIYMRNKDVDKE